MSKENNNRAAANKAAEEFELPELPHMETIGQNSDEYFYGHDDDAMQAYGRKCIAADRASRQVANKAEVEPASGCDNCEDGYIYDTSHTRREQCRDCATPPATTGASTCQTCGGSKVDPGGLPICRDCGPVGASTVLTDERNRVREEFEIAKKLGARFCTDSAMMLVDELVKSVAAQAAQVAVPEGFVIVPESPTLEMLDAANVPRRLNFDSLSIYKAMIEAAPSPAKESK